MEALTQNIYNMYIPFLFVIGLVLQTPVYGSTLIKDRQDDLRYFLKFSGASSAPYLIGILLADSFLLMISFSLLLFWLVSRAPSALGGSTGPEKIYAS